MRCVFGTYTLNLPFPLDSVTSSGPIALDSCTFSCPGKDPMGKGGRTTVLARLMVGGMGKRS